MRMIMDVMSYWPSCLGQAGVVIFILYCWEAAQSSCSPTPYHCQYRVVTNELSQDHKAGRQQQLPHEHELLRSREDPCS